MSVGVRIKLDLTRFPSTAFAVDTSHLFLENRFRHSILTRRTCNTVCTARIASPIKAPTFYIDEIGIVYTSTAEETNTTRDGKIKKHEYYAGTVFFAAHTGRDHGCRQRLHARSTLPNVRLREAGL